MKNERLRHFASYYKPHLGLFILDMTCAFLVAAIDLMFPMISRQALQKYLPQLGEAPEAIRPFALIIGLLVVMYGLRTVMQFVVDYYGHILGVRIEYDMRKELFSHLQKLSFRFYDDNRTGKIMSRMINDLNEMTELAHHGPEDLFLSLVMLIGSFVALLLVEWRLALIVYIVVPILAIFAIYRRKKMSRSFREVKKKVAGVNADLESSISGIRVAKSFVNEAHEVDKFDQGNRKFRHAKDNAYKNMAIFMSGMSFMTNILNVLVLGFGGYFIYKGHMDYADLIAFTLYVNAFLIPIRRLTMFVQQFESGMTGFDRFREILNEDPEIKDDPKAHDLDQVTGDIRFDHVGFSYNHHEKVLHDINLYIKAWTSLALVGPSGGGKTTLCHLIPRFYETTEGMISIDGKDIKKLTMTSLRSNIGLVSQDVHLFAGTIRDNILYGRIEASEEDMIQAAKDAQIHSFIMGLEAGYDTQVGERGIRLSGGQKQRLSIARVFLKDPQILILDEATSALDNATEIRIQAALEKLSKGRTSIVIAHRLSTIKNADQIVVITEDGIEEEGSHDELLDKGQLYAKLYQAQFKGYMPDQLKS